MICEECGLDTLICNALSCFRHAARNYERGRLDEARDDVKEAEWYYDRYMAARKTHVV